MLEKNVLKKQKKKGNTCVLDNCVQVVYSLTHKTQKEKGKAEKEKKVYKNTSAYYINSSYFWPQVSKEIIYTLDQEQRIFTKYKM